MFIDAVPLSSVNIESWPRDSLHILFKKIQSLQIEEMSRLTASIPTEHFFVSSQDYAARRMWHEDLVVYGTTRDVLSDSGEQVQEHGYLAIPHDVAPGAYVLRDAVLRVYAAPAYTEYLLESGKDYEAKVLAQHPNAIMDVTSDLTQWHFFDPDDGRTVGAKSYPRDGNH